MQNMWQTEQHWCKIWGSRGGDYEECRLLGHRNPIRTSHETHYVSATDSSRLMLCKIWGFNGGDYEECRLLGLSHVALVRTTRYNIPEDGILQSNTEARFLGIFRFPMPFFIKLPTWLVRQLQVTIFSPDVNVASLISLWVILYLNFL
jgi:hypothetical protein